jgi:hypothetical protein
MNLEEQRFFARSANWGGDHFLEGRPRNPPTIPTANGSAMALAIEETTYRMKAMAKTRPTQEKREGTM